MGPRCLRRALEWHQAPCKAACFCSCASSSACVAVRFLSVMLSGRARSTSAWDLQAANVASASAGCHHCASQPDCGNDRAHAEHWAGRSQLVLQLATVTAGGQQATEDVHEAAAYRSPLPRLDRCMRWTGRKLTWPSSSSNLSTTLCSTGSAPSWSGSSMIFSVVLPHPAQLDRLVIVQLPTSAQQLAHLRLVDNRPPAGQPNRSLRLGPHSEDQRLTAAAAGAPGAQADPSG